MKNMKYKVLAADDEFWSRENIRNLILWEEYSLEFLEPACDGEEVIERIAEEKPDIILTDINMPFLSGLELLQRLQNEMAHVRNYLYVMDVRNGSTIAYDYQIDSDTLADQMPRICIQPVVENALTHGLRNVRRKDKKLLIRSEHVNENLVITVQDNGAGMDAESMNRLLDQNDMKRVESGISIGILNVNARLKRLFGEKYGLHIESTAGEGTTVTITVPAVSTENSGDMENV